MIGQTPAMLQTTDHGRVRVLTFDRPDALNAMNNDLYWAATDGLAAAAADPGVAVVVLTGIGRAFCAGQDMGEMGGGSSSTRGTAASTETPRRGSCAS